ncbi:MAG: Integral membrane protein, partial [uncultured Quadrisphaera sp.]
EHHRGAGAAAGAGAAGGARAADPVAGRGDHRVQRRRGRRGAGRGGARLVLGAGRVRRRLGDRGRLGARGGVAVLRPRPRGPRAARAPGAARGRRLLLRPRGVRHRRRRRCAGRRAGGAALDRRPGAGRGQPGGDAGAVHRPAPRGPRARLALGGRRLRPDDAVHLPLRGAPGRARAEQRVRLVVGRPGRGPGHRRGRGARGGAGVARRRLLRPDGDGRRRRPGRRVLVLRAGGRRRRSGRGARAV